MTFFESIQHALNETENKLEWVFVFYKILISIIIIIPLMFLVGFISGMLLLKNPYACGVGLVNQTF